MEIKEIICKRWILNNATEGITLYPFIFYKGTPSDEIIKHEWGHVNQIKRHGVFNFYIKYIYYHFKYGYINNPFEVEAYKSSETLIKETL